MPCIEGWIFKITCLPHWFLSLESHGCIQRIILFTTNYWWYNYSHGIWHSNPRWRKGLINLEHGVFKNVLYVPSLTTNMLYVYHMTHIRSPKWVVFDLDLVEISKISNGKLIEKGVANHSFKEYEFSHFLSYLDRVQSQLPFKREGKFILPKPFSYDYVSINVSHLEIEAEDQVE